MSCFMCRGDSNKEVQEANEENNLAFVAIRVEEAATPLPTETPGSSPTPVPYNLYPDERIDIMDLIEFIKCMRDNNLRGDFNQDGEVDAQDLYLLSIRYEKELPLRRR